jgi:hypothetical protein
MATQVPVLPDSVLTQYATIPGLAGSTPSYDQDFWGKWFGDFSGEDGTGILGSKGATNMLGLAGMGFGLWNNYKDRKLKEKAINGQLAGAKDAFNAKVDQYGNALARANSIDAQQTGNSNFKGSRKPLQHSTIKE